MRTTTKTLITVGLVGAAVAAGCGDDDDDEPAGVSKADFVAQAGAICERNKERSGRAFEREFGRRRVGPADGPRVLAVTLPHIRASGDQIARLEPPAEDRDEIAAYLAAYRKATTEMEAIARDPERAAALMRGRLEDPFTRPDAMAGAYGIEKCSGDDE